MSPKFRSRFVPFLSPILLSIRSFELSNNRSRPFLVTVNPPAALVAGSSDIRGRLICPFFVTVEIIYTHKCLILRLLYDSPIATVQGKLKTQNLWNNQPPSCIPQGASSPVFVTDLTVAPILSSIVIVPFLSPSGIMVTCKLLTSRQLRSQELG